MHSGEGSYRARDQKQRSREHSAIEILVPGSKFKINSILYGTSLPMPDMNTTKKCKIQSFVRIFSFLANPDEFTTTKG